MTENEPGKSPSDFNRRDFIRSSATFGSLMLMMGGIPLHAEDSTNAAPVETNFSTQSPPVSCALIGCGVWGREILKTLATLPNAPVMAICDTYAPYLKRVKRDFAPNADTFDDYQKLLAQKNVEAVIVAT